MRGGARSSHARRPLCGGVRGPCRGPRRRTIVGCCRLTSCWAWRVRAPHSRRRAFFTSLPATCPTRAADCPVSATGAIIRGAMGLRLRVLLLVILPMALVVGVYWVVRVRQETGYAIEAE